MTSKDMTSKDKKELKKLVELCEHELRLLVATSRLCVFKEVKVPREISDQMFADTMGWGINGNKVWKKEEVA